MYDSFEESIEAIFNLFRVEKRILSFPGLFSSFHHLSRIASLLNILPLSIILVQVRKQKTGNKKEHHGFEAKQLHILLLQNRPHFTG